MSFVQIGIDYQYSATTADMADRAFATSCDICASTGKHIECAMCKISAAHELMLTMLALKSTKH